MTSQPWVEVWIDGHRVARETPLRGYEISSGPHAFRFVPPKGAAIEKTMSVSSGRNLTLFVDVAARRVEIEP